MSMPAETSTASGARPCRRLLIQLAIVLVAGAIAGLVRFHPWDRGPNVLEYTIVLNDSRAGVALTPITESPDPATGSRRCEGRGAYAFLHSGAPVNVLRVSAEDDLLASGTLTQGATVGSNLEPTRDAPTENGLIRCQFTLSIEVPYAQEYLIVVGADDDHPGNPLMFLYSREDLQASNWITGIDVGAWAVRKH